MATPNLALRGIRHQRELSLAELASRAGITAAQVSRIETGQRGASIKTLVALADALGVEPALIGGPSVTDGEADREIAAKIAEANTRAGAA